MGRTLGAAAVLVSAMLAACADRETAEVARTSTLHLARLLEDAAVDSASAPMTAREQRTWVFPKDLWEWNPLDVATRAWLAEVTTDGVDGAAKIGLVRPSGWRGLLLIGGLALELEEGLLLRDWEALRIRARTNDRFAGLTIAHNLEDESSVPGWRPFFYAPDRAPPLFSDGSEQTYVIPFAPREDEGLETPLRSIGILAGATDPSSLEVLSIELVPRGASYLDDYGLRHVIRAGESRATLFAHAPASLRYELEIPADARLDFGLTAEQGERVRYRLTATAGEGEPAVIFDETVSDPAAWRQVSVDLSTLGGSRVELELEATSERQGAVAFWGAPVLSAGRPEAPTNVVFYVIDGAGSDLMSAYGYERPTTPFLEALATDGFVFERAYSNSTWTQPSTASFMTSLQHSVLGGLRRGNHSSPVPLAATTMAEHFSRAGYLTASFTANPNAGRLLGLERGVDVLRDGETEHHSTSSKDLHEFFWDLLASYPGGPWWVHFQTTDVHEPNQPHEPFAGRLVSEEQTEQLRGWDQQIFQVAGADFGHTSIEDFYRTALARAGIDRHAYFDTRRGLYDETMMHQDFQLAELVEGLKESGLWENTLLIIGSDHGHPAGTFARFGRGLLEPQPELWEGALFDSYATGVPLMFIWPGRIEGGQGFSEPVSMLDVLPTVLDLVGLPQPDVLQGQSLAPLLRGRELEVRPVILDEFRIDDESGAMVGNLEIVDGRWGASLEIGPGEPDGLGRHSVPVGGRWGAVHPYYPDVPSLLLYDLEADPFATAAVNDEHPELVEKYRALLLAQWEAHQALSTRFQEVGEVDLTPEQLRQLQTLGYIQ